MNIQTAPRSAPVYKPVFEAWTLNDSDVGLSTADVVKLGEKANDVPATYHFTTQASPAQFTTGEKVGNALGMGVQSAVAGAAFGAGLGVGLAFLDGLGDLANLFLGGRGGGTSKLVVLIPTLLGAVGAGVAGTVAGYKQEARPEGGELPGTLKAQGDSVRFYPHGQISREVNLNEYQTATQAPWSQPEQGSSQTVAQRVVGAAVGAALPVASFMPLASGFAGYKIGERMDTRTELGKGLGIALGVGLSAASWTAAQLGGWQAVAALSVGMGALGAVVAPQAYRSEPQYQAGQQWWTPPSQG